MESKAKQSKIASCARADEAVPLQQWRSMARIEIA